MPIFWKEANGENIEKHKIILAKIFEGLSIPQIIKDIGLTVY